jgi:hypothetical protein
LESEENELIDLLTDLKKNTTPNPG